MAEPLRVLCLGADDNALSGDTSKLQHEDMELCIQDGCISVVVVQGSDGDGFALLNAAELETQFEVTMKKNGEWGIGIGLVTRDEYAKMVASRVSSEGLDSRKDPTDRMVRFAVSETLDSKASDKIERLKLLKDDGSIKLHKDGEALFDVPVDCHWFVFGEGHDGDFGEPEVVLRLTRLSAQGASACEEAPRRVRPRQSE